MAHVDPNRPRPGIISGAFWLDVLERSVKTAAQALAALWTSDVAFNAFDFDWINAGQIAWSAAMFSIITSVASAPFGAKSTAGLVG